MKWNYYSEWDDFASAWLREAIKDGLIPDGEIDTRSICDVRAEDIRGFRQLHFFAGIGGWPYALQLAGWPRERPVVTASLPCQPFSGAGQQKGEADDRHLWPVFRELVPHFDPAAILFGEQVASALGREWLAGVRADLEALGYGVGASDLCAPGVAAPHIRQRLYWVGVPAEGRRGQGRTGEAIPTWGSCGTSERSGADSGLAHHHHPRLERRDQQGRGCTGELSPWASSVVVPCADGKWRRVPANEETQPEPTLFPLAYGIPNRVGTLRGAGNAIVPPLAAEFVRACQEVIG